MYQGLIAVDLDGTLLQKGFYIAEKDRLALKKAHDAGFLVAICSGRSVHLVRRKLPEWQLTDIADVVIGCNGAEYFDVFNNGEAEALGFITRAGVQEALRLAAPEKIDFAWYSATEIFTNTGNPHLNDIIKQTEMPVVYIAKEKLGESFPERWPKALFFFYSPAQQFLKAKIESERREAYDLVLSEELLMEMIPQGINKGTAVKEIAKRKDIDLRCSMAVGDNLNDSEMLESCAFSVAMGNGVEALKETADFVTADLQDCGVALAVDKFLKDSIYLDQGGNRQ